MKIDKYTLEAAEEYRKAKAAWRGIDVHTADPKEVEAAQRAHHDAAVSLAETLLLDIDRAKARP